MTTPIPLTRASQFSHVAAALEGCGVSPERVLRRANLPMRHFGDPDDLIPLRDTFLFMHHAARLSGDENFGLVIGRSNSVDSLGSFGKLLSSSLTVRDAADTLCRLVSKFTSVSRFWLTEDGDEAWLCRQPVEMFEVGDRQMELYVLMQLIHVVRLGAGPKWSPAKIALHQEVRPGLELPRDLAGAEIRGRQRFTAIAIPRSILGREVRRRPGDAGASQMELLSRLHGTAPAHAFAGSVRQVAGSLLSEGTLRIETVAEIAGLPVRSLQRRLRADGHSYSGLVEQARYLAARKLLTESEIKIVEIALDVGYSDAAHFNRAFRRWAGLTPREFRRQQLAA